MPTYSLSMQCLRSALQATYLHMEAVIHRSGPSFGTLDVSGPKKVPIILTSRTYLEGQEALSKCTYDSYNHYVIVFMT